jgi:hypothetical protein
MSRASKSQIRAAYNVSESDVNAIINDTACEIGNTSPGDVTGQKERLDAAYSVANTKEWTRLKTGLQNWLRSSSKWAERFQDQAISDTIHTSTLAFITSQARTALREGLWQEFNFPRPPVKIEPSDGAGMRMRSTSPGSTAASVTGKLEHMAIKSLPHPLQSLRDYSVEVDCADSLNGIHEALIPFANLVPKELKSRRDQPIRRHDVHLAALDQKLATKFGLPIDSRAYSVLSTGDIIRNEPEWQAALADFMKGIRGTDTADMTLRSTPRGSGDPRREWRGEDTAHTTALRRVQGMQLHADTTHYSIELTSEP